jgi:TonB family protein
MIPFSDTREIVSRFGDSIEDLHEVFRCNGVDFGLPEDFFAFARTMKHHSELRDDVARVAKSLMQNETSVSLRIIVTIIAVASGGAEVATSDREMTSPINLVIDSLISAGVCGRFLADELDLPCSDPTATDFGSSNALAESLSRLEMGSLQLKTYLNSIDERINRIEPRLKNVSAPAQSVSPAHASDEAKARFSEISAVRELPPASDGLFRAGERDRPSVVATRLWIDFRRFFFSRRQMVLPVLLGVVTLLLAVSFAWKVGHRVNNAAVLSPLNASVGGGGDVSGQSLVPHEASSGSDSVVAPVREKKSAQIHFKAPSPKPSVRAVDPKTSLVAVPKTSESAVSPDRTSMLSSEQGSNHLVNVSAGVMEANLVSGPKPSYPMLASLAHMKGNVVMQAVISKDGTVKQVQVIQGHRLLRGAAKNAVRTWRYRPYKVAGVPVEVATTVTVDFNLHQ